MKLLAKLPNSNRDAAPAVLHVGPVPRCPVIRVRITTRLEIRITAVKGVAGLEVDIRLFGQRRDKEFRATRAGFRVGLRPALGIAGGIQRVGNWISDQQGTR